MDEKQLESQLCSVIRAGANDPSRLESLMLHGSTSPARNIADLIGAMPYSLVQDHSNWNPHPKLMVELTGRMTPDIVIRSTTSEQNRIYIEVKKTRGSDMERWILRSFGIFSTCLLHRKAHRYAALTISVAP